LRGEPGGFVDGGIAVVLRSPSGVLLPGVRVTWSAEGLGSGVVDAAKFSDADGVARAQWRLGTNAAVQYTMSVTAVYPGVEQLASFAAIAVPSNVEVLRAAVDSIVGQVGDTVALGLDATDPYGNHFAPDSVAWSAGDTSRVAFTPDKRIVLTGRGATAVVVRSGTAADTVLVRAQQVVARIVAADSIVFTSLGERRTLGTTLLDRRGLVVSDSIPAVAITDTSIAVFDSSGLIVARANGTTVLVLRSDTLITRVRLAVRQVPATMSASLDSLVFDALGAVDSIRAVAHDSLGVPIPDAVVETQIADASVATVNGTHITSAGNGRTTLLLASGVALRSVPVTVAQRAVTLSIDETIFAAPRSARVGETIDLGVRGTDRLGNAITSPSLRVKPDAVGVVDAGLAGSVSVVGSGWVDLRITSADIVLTRRLQVYLAPDLLEREASDVRLVGLPDSVSPWAPTLVAAPNGTTRLYFGAYKPSPADVIDRADLDYFESTDGQLFTYRGIAIPHGPAATDLYGWGIENIAIVPRNDGPGFRLYFAGGSTTLGWQVFSAVGDGVGQWTTEAGIRLPNDGGNSPEGEGMVVVPREGGGYRMIEGSMVMTKVASGSWQIVEYQSDDQLNWTFRREHLAQGADGKGTARAVYSPTIVRFGRGVYRMFYTGDNFRVSPTPQSNMLSAVSFDLESWVPEGIFIAAGAEDVMYASALGNRVAYLLTRCGGCKVRLAIASIRQR
jgi:hypothetical protein